MERLRIRIIRIAIMIFPVYKEKGPTSNRVLNKIRKIAGTKKVGHAGTLDPLARGILVVAIGRDSTKRLSEIVGQEKEYVAEIKLGESSTTDDMEGEKTAHKVDQIPNQSEVEQVLQSFIGEQQQIPPIFSAIKIKGKEAYKLARQGKEVEMKSRKVMIKAIELLAYDWPMLKIRVVTGKGVYIRSLARDIGKSLRVGGGYLTDLERTRIGRYTKEDSVIEQGLESFCNKYKLIG